MRYKKRPKNKQELKSASGSSPKSVFRDKIIFEFEADGRVFRNGMEGRLKLDHNGYFTFVIKKDNKWCNVRGKLKKLKVIKERKVAGNTKVSA